MGVLPNARASRDGIDFFFFFESTKTKLEKSLDLENATQWKTRRSLQKSQWPFSGWSRLDNTLGTKIVEVDQFWNSNLLLCANPRFFLRFFIFSNLLIFYDY